MVQKGVSFGAKEVNSKLVVVGDCACGKTTLIKRFITGDYREAYEATGFDKFTTTYNVSSTYTIHMTLWDTSGDSGYDRARPLAYTDADLVIICFSIGNPESLFNVVTKWYPEVRVHCPTQPVMVVGCGSDLRTDSKTLAQLSTRNRAPVTYEQGLNRAKEIDALVYSETSSKTSERSVKDVLEVAALSSVGHKNSENTQLKRQRSFIRRKRFNGLGDAQTTLKKEAAKGCVVM